MANDRTVSCHGESETSLGTYPVFSPQQDWPWAAQYLTEVTHDERSRRSRPAKHERRRQAGLPSRCGEEEGKGQRVTFLAP